MDPITLGAAKAAARHVPIEAAHNWGHSYAFGIGASDQWEKYGAAVARRLGTVERMEAVSGTVLSDQTSGASWPKILQRVTRVGRGAVSGSVTGTGRRAFEAPPGLHVIMYGVNDLNVRGNDATVMAGYKHCLRAAVSRLRAGAVFEDSDSSVAFGGTWATFTGTSENSGSGYRYATSTASTYTITTPADFPGGTVAIGTTSRTPATTGAVHSVQLNGGTTYTLDARNPQSSGYIACVLRIPNVPAGVNTLVGTLSNLTTLTAFDYWQWEPPVTSAPPVLLLKQPYPVDYSLYGSVAPGPPTDAGVDVLNQIIADVAAEFDAKVRTVDLSGMNRDATMFAADKLHPSDKGHRYIAEAIVATVQPWALAPGTALQRRREDYGTAAPTGTTTYYYAGDIVWNTAPAEAGSAAAKYVTTGWICTVDGRPGTWLPMNTLTGN